MRENLIKITGYAEEPNGLSRVLTEPANQKLLEYERKSNKNNRVC